MGERRRQQPVSEIEMLENVITEKVTKSIQESLNIGFHSFLQSLEQADSNKSTKVTDTERSQTNSNKEKNVKDEPVTPRSRKMTFSFRGSNYRRKDKDVKHRYKCSPTVSPSSSKHSSMIREAPNRNAATYFKWKCDLRISIPNGSMTSSDSHRTVYKLDCGNDSEKFVETRENSHGKFENYYESSSPHSVEMDLSGDEDDHYITNWN